MSEYSQYLFLVPLFPLIGFLLNGLLLGRLPRPLISFIGCASVGLSLLMSALLFFDLKGMPPEARLIEQTLFSWIPAGSLHVNIGYLLFPAHRLPFR